jgi:hypothetical protein
MLRLAMHGTNIKQNIVKSMDFMYTDLRPKVWDVVVYCDTWRRVVIFKIISEETGFFWNIWAHVPNCTLSHPRGS